MRQLAHFEIETISAAAHEVIRQYCRLLGDYTHQSWESAPEWQRDSTRAGVLGIARNEWTAEQAHDSWCQLKLAQGWKYGPKKDPEKREHPCLVPRNQLPVEQQYKDDLFMTTVKSMLDGLWRLPA